MSKPKQPLWEFETRFNRRTCKDKPRVAAEALRKAAREVERAADKDPMLAAEGAVALLRRLPGALAGIGESSLQVHSALEAATAELARIIAAAPADLETRDNWLNRLWQTYESDQAGWTEPLAERWGELCAGEELALHWGEHFCELAEIEWMASEGEPAHFPGTVIGLSALLAAGRPEQVLETLEGEPGNCWYYRKFGVKALLAMGRKAEAIQYAEACNYEQEDFGPIAEACEQILLSSGFAEEAYQRYGLPANEKFTYLETFRAMVRKYPHKQPAEILEDLAAFTVGEEGHWFAAAKDAGLFDQALALAARSPSDPRTLARAAHDHLDTNPAFAAGCGHLALYWVAKGHGRRMKSAEIQAVLRNTLAAAEKLGNLEETRTRIAALPKRGVLTRALGDLLDKG